jgi:hypothetical protein
MFREAKQHRRAVPSRANLLHNSLAALDDVGEEFDAVQKTMGNSATSSRRSRYALMFARIFLFRRAVSMRAKGLTPSPRLPPAPPFPLQSPTCVSQSGRRKTKSLDSSRHGFSVHASTSGMKNVYAEVCCETRGRLPYNCLLFHLRSSAPAPPSRVPSSAALQVCTQLGPGRCGGWQ